MISETLTEGAVAMLLEAERTRTAILPLTDSYPEMGEEAAYRVQEEFFAARGSTQVGYKLGFTSRAMREQMGIEKPNYGRLAEDMVVDSDAGPILLSGLIQPRVEPEVALLVERDLRGPGLVPTMVRPAVRWAFGALEVVDSRYQNYRFRAEDNTADNSSAARFVLGPPTSLAAAPDLRLAGALLWRGGRLVASGAGAAALGDPMLAVAWLADRLGEEGGVLEAGSIVLTGGLTKADSVGGGGTFVAEFCGMGTVKVHFSGEES